MGQISRCCGKRSSHFNPVDFALDAANRREWLRRQLADGPKSRLEILRRGAEHCWSSTQMYRTKLELGVKTTYNTEEGDCLWALPPDDTPVSDLRALVRSSYDAVFPASPLLDALDLAAETGRELLLSDAELPFEEDLAALLHVLKVYRDLIAQSL